MSLSQLPLLTLFAAAAVIVCVGLLVYEWLFRYRDQLGERLASDFGDSQSETVERTRLFKDLSKLARQTDEDTEDHARSLDRLIEQSGLTVSVRQLLASCIVSAGVGGLIAGLTSGWWLAALIACVVMLPAPLLFVAVQRERRLQRLRLQLPDAFEMMSRSIRAGQTVTAAFSTVADDFEPPIADEFAWCFEQQNLGLPQEVALRDLARRSGVPELQMLVVALLVQRQFGGSPVELLDNLASVVRRRIELQEKIKTLTAEGRMQAAVLLLLPPLLLWVITMLNPDYVSKLWTRPALLGGMFVSMLLGVLWIRRILRLEF